MPFPPNIVRDVRRSLPHRLWMLFLLAALPLCALSTRAQTPYQLKAAVLGNLAKFVEWPETSFSSHSAPIRIGIFGQDPFGPDLATILASVKVRGRSFQFEHSSRVEKLIDCHIIFVSEGETERLPEIVSALDRRPVVLVGDHPRFLELGGTINFHMEDRKVRFAINLAAAERAKISINPQLLRLASTVIGKESSK